MLDLDDFKQINDTKGHPAGDAVLKAAAERMRREVRPYDVVGRYGGEEFMVVLPACDGSTAEAVTERIRAQIAATPVPTRDGPIPVTASLGLAFCDGAAEPDQDALLRAADGALYRAKENGKNRVERA